jgi:hypothetical protein
MESQPACGLAGDGSISRNPNGFGKSQASISIDDDQWLRPQHVCLFKATCYPGGGLLTQLMPQAPPQHEPLSHEDVADESTLDLPAKEIAGADMSFAWRDEPQWGHTTSSRISRTLW